ncbi:MAG TPA: PTS sugar transporter subunit IIC [Thermotogota bacterium]|nr:PTS sugar transporter subunit IIC [Thermotogota bacterium]HRW91561.1 PTS sugar transporter subunit IIC [Thermotogota bacterium]
MPEETRKRRSFRQLAIDALNGMALGLFASLIIGLILKQLGDFLRWELLSTLGLFAQRMMGPAIGAGVAYSLKTPPLGIFSVLVTGAIGAGTLRFVAQSGAWQASIGEPVGALVAALAGVIIAKTIAGKTRVDIVLVPALTILGGGLVGVFFGPLAAAFMNWLGGLINQATVLQPIPMGIIVSSAMGMILTLPISSAALAISLQLSGLAAGASVVGCSCQMIGFAVMGFRENGVGGLLAQGLGTSMLQIPNIIKNPWIWVPPTLASAILGPFATTLFGMQNNPVGAGMGTSGLVGQIGTFAAMEGLEPGWSILLKIGLLHFLLPAILSLSIAYLLRKYGKIREGDLKLPPG